MRRTDCSFAGVLALSVSLFSCDPPAWTPQKGYAHAQRCFAALDTNLKLVSAARFKKAGIDPGAVDLVKTENMNGAYDDGKQIGMSPTAIYDDLEEASAAYLKTHTWQSPGSATRKFIALGNEVNDCLLDYYGRPND